MIRASLIVTSTLFTLSANAQVRHPLVLTTLAAGEGTRINAGDPSDFMPDLVKLVGDVNGDGIGDIALGANFGDMPGASTNEGEVQIIYGRRNGYPATLNLATLAPNAGFNIYGDLNGPGSIGRAFDGGDFNGDGISDLAVAHSGWEASPAVPGAGPEGLLGLFFGKPGGLSTQSISQLYTTSGNTGARGFIALGLEDNERLGVGNDTIAMADINGDGYRDILVGSTLASRSGRTRCGVVYAIFGTPFNFGPGFDLSGINGINGTIFVGAEANDAAGGVVAKAGDINGDGIEDVVIVAASADGVGNARGNSGEAYVVYGRRSWPASVDLAATYSGDGSLYSVVYGSDNSRGFGMRVGNAGDVNADGYADLLVSLTTEETDNLNSGATWLFLGAPGGIGASIDLADDNAGDLRFIGDLPSDSFGEGLTGRLDLNGDGIHDFAIGAPETEDIAPLNIKFGAGAVYLAYGSTSFNIGENIGAQLDGENGVLFRGGDAFESAGYRISSAGDFNADGIGDLLIGARGGNRAYVVYGKRAASVTQSLTSLFAAPGDGPGGETVPPVDLGEVVRAVVDFSDEDNGAAPGGGPSEVTGKILFSSPNGPGLPSVVAPTYWELTTDRENWESAQLTFAFLDDEVSAFTSDPADWRVYFRPSDMKGGAWTEMATTIDAELRTAAVDVTELGLFALGDPGATGITPGEFFIIR